MSLGCKITTSTSHKRHNEISLRGETRDKAMVVVVQPGRVISDGLALHEAGWKLIERRGG